MDIVWDQEEFEYFQELSDNAKYNYLYDVLVLEDQPFAEDEISHRVSYEDNFCITSYDSKLVLNYADTIAKDKCISQLFYDGLLLVAVENSNSSELEDKIFPYVKTYEVLSSLAYLNDN
jgi:hypothetical protein